MSEKLTVNDPISAETLKQFATLGDAKKDMAMTLLSLEQEKIRILATARRVEEQLTRLFEVCLVDRGISPDAEVEIDPKTGQITLKSEPVDPLPATEPVA